MNKKNLKPIMFSLFFFLINTYANGQDVFKKLVEIPPDIQMWTEVSGHGSPVVILINGGGDTIETEWTQVIPSINSITTVLAYDRAGEIKSQPLPNLEPRTAKDVVNRLRLLLKALNLKPPYVLVAHSIGGLYAQYYARNYPGEISGIVSIDGNLVEQSFPEKIPGISNKTVIEIQKENNDHVKKLHDELVSTLKMIHQKKQTPEETAQIEYSLEVMGKKESAQQVMDSPPLPKNLFLSVLSAGNDPLENEIQKNFSNEVPKHVLYIFPTCGHYIQNCVPNKVNEIIKQTIINVQSDNFRQSSPKMSGNNPAFSC